MRSIHLLAAVLALGPLALCATARAQDPSDPDWTEPTPQPESAPPRTPTADDRRLAADLLDRSAVAYRLGRYGEAAAMLEDAYALSREPILLYNLGRAYENGGDARRAAFAYRRYLAAATEAPDAEAVLATIALLEEGLERERLAAEEAERARAEEELRRREEAEQAQREARARAERAARERARAERAASERSTRMTVAWAIAGVGAAGIVAGIAPGVLALDRRDAAAREPIQVEAASALAEGRDLATAANVALVAGGLVAAAGIAWGVLELTGAIEDGASTEVEVAPTAGGIAIRGRF